jgi:phage baseplate assembly protein gpV
MIPVALTSSYCSGVHALAGFVPGLFACSFPTPSNTQGSQVTEVSVGSLTSQSQELLVYVH